ncbi:ABC transporter ATP-binding protein [Clostridium sp. YIM B02505]|uniref:ABC transporter ATP-binding protein n=2 Tax=Clostridium yunnanense TaxID=2800325 RepID=A0ABS1EJK9_9CLOT|nr:ABC transporter ATP-binding protein [Clostridium yunnanense]
MKIKNNLYIKFFLNIKKDKKMYFIMGILMILTAVLSMQCPSLIVKITDKAIKYENFHELTYFIALYLLVGVFLFITSFLSDYIYIKIGNRVKLDLRMRLLTKISRFSGVEINESNTGELISIIQYDVENIQEFVTKMLFNFIADIITAIGLIIIMFKLEYRLVFIAILIQIVIFFSQKFFNKKIFEESIRLRENYGKGMSILQEFLNSIAHFLFLNVRDTFLRKYFEISNEGMEKNVRLQKYNSLNSYVYQLIGTVQSCIIFGYGGYMVIRGDITFGIFMVFVTYVQKLFTPFIRVTRLSAQLKMLKVSIERIMNVLEFEDRDVNASNIDKIDIKHFGSNIKFNNISFSYDNKTTVLNNLNLSLNSNKINAIVGQSGSGKTTIINLLFRMWKFEMGEVYIGDINIKEMPMDLLRQNIIVISQNTFLLNDSIKNNISLYDSRISEDEIYKIIEVVGLVDFIEKLPNKIETQIGENGLKLSGGQRQKLAIARAILRQAPIIIFDEATSAMDNISEKLIMQNIKSYLKNKTVIMIAHRLTTIKDADVIHVIRNGTIVESGTHKELLQKGQEYSKLYLKKSV